MIYVLNYYDNTIDTEGTVSTNLGSFSTWDKTIETIRASMKFNDQTCGAVDRNTGDLFDPSRNIDMGAIPAAVDFILDNTGCRKYYEVTRMLFDGN